MVVKRDGDVDCAFSRMECEFELDYLKQCPQFIRGQLGEPTGKEWQQVQKRFDVGQHGRLCRGLASK
jgi:hypothetical protein